MVIQVFTEWLWLAVVKEVLVLPLVVAQQGLELLELKEQEPFLIQAHQRQVLLELVMQAVVELQLLVRLVFQLVVVRVMQP
jgi:hypothetical protein